MKNKFKKYVFALFLLIVLISIILTSAFNFNSNIFTKTGQLKVTPEHPFLVGGKWLVASELKIGDELTNIYGKKIRIKSIKSVHVPEGVNVYNLEAGIYNDFILKDGIVAHNSNRPQLSELEKQVADSFGITPGQKNLETILNEEYPQLINRLSSQSKEDLKDNLRRIGKEAGATDEEIAEIARLIDNFDNDGIEIQGRRFIKGDSRTNEEFDFPETVINSQTITDDIKSYNNHMKKTLEELPSVREIAISESDMDVLTTGLSREKGIPPIKRNALNRDHFGGEGSSMYDDMTRALENAKKEASLFPETGRVVEFERIAKKNMNDLIDSYPEMIGIWETNVKPFISGKGDVLFADVGFRGTMQFWEAAMFERLNPGKKGFVDIAFVKAINPLKETENAYQGFIRNARDQFSSETQFKKFFGRNNAEMVSRILEKTDRNGGRAIMRISEKNYEDFSESLIRLWQASKYTP
jgi:hypothetical protein